MTFGPMKKSANVSPVKIILKKSTTISSIKIWLKSPRMLVLKIYILKIIDY